MNVLQEAVISCPYCGEMITILVDESIEKQQYTEDCEVCCRPMVITVEVPEIGGLRVDVRSEND